MTGIPDVDVELQREMARLRERIAELEAQLVSSSVQQNDTGTAGTNRYRQLIESLGVVIWEADAETWQFNYVSEQARAVTGYAPEEWYVPNFWLDHIHPEDRAWAAEYCRACGERGESHEFRFRFRAKDGRTLWVHEIVTVVTEHDKPVQLRGVMIDITKEVETQAALDRSESMLRKILESSSDILFRLDRGGMCLDVFAAQEDELCIPPDQLWHRPITETLPPGHAQQTLDAIIRAIDTQDAQSFEYSGEELGKPDRYWEARIVPINDNEVIAHCREVTEQRQERELLIEKQRFLSTLISNLPGYVYRCYNDPYWTMEYMSDGVAVVTGYPADEFVKSRTVSAGRIIHPEDTDRIWRAVQQAITERRSFELTYRIFRADGTVRWIAEYGTGIYGENGELLSLEGFVTDVTSRIKMEEQLRHRLNAESLVAAISSKFIDRPEGTIDRVIDDTLRQVGHFTNSDRCYIFLIDDDQVSFSNTHEWCAPGIEPQAPTLQNLPMSDFQYAWERLKRSETIQICNLDELPDSAAMERQVLEEGRIRSIALVPLSYRGAVVGLLGLDAVRCERNWPKEDIALLRTIGEIVISALEARWSELALRDSERKYKMLAENTSDFISMHDAAGRYLYISPAVEKITGYKPHELEGRDVYEFIHPHDRNHLHKESHLLSTESDSAEVTWRFVTKQGMPIWCETRTTLIRDNAGNPYRLICVTRNVTEQREFESQLRRANERQRLLLRELDHRVRNNLASLAALIDLSSRDATDVQEFAASVRGRVHAMSAVHGLLSRGRWSTVNLKELLFALLPSDLHDQIAFEGDDLEFVATQGTAIGMILQELVANSLKYGSLSIPRGRVLIRSKATDADEPANSRQLELHWREEGGPVVLEQGKAGLGTTLIQGIVRGELRGSVELTYPQSGAEHHFTLQLDPVNEKES